MKKIVASILVKNQIVVSSTGFSSHKPIGSLEQILTRLQDWEVDEISILNLSHSENPLNDFRGLFSDSLLSAINTPIAYGGGIDSQTWAESIIASGCERVILSGTSWTPEKSREISVNLGDQAILIHLPLVRTNSEISLTVKNVTLQEYFERIPGDWGGELYLKNREMDGLVSETDFFKEVNFLARNLKTPILAGGGLSCYSDVKELLELTKVKGVVIGNWLNREELVIPKIKKLLGRSAALRSLVRYE